MYEIAAVDLSKIYFLENAKKACKPNNRDLNHDWKDINYTLRLNLSKTVYNDLNLTDLN